MNIPRIMIAAPKSGSGKTLVTCSLLGALRDREIETIAYKCGPDYIDPMFHRALLGVRTENLDTFFSTPEEVRILLAESYEDICSASSSNNSRAECVMDNTYCEKNEQIDAPCSTPVAVMEGVMGLYDGLVGIAPEGSAYHLAQVTKTPIILVVDVHGMGRSMIPMIRGMVDYDKEGLIRGVILNRISTGFYETMQPVLEEELPVPVLGYMPVRKDLTLESRHLGLKLPEEIADLKSILLAAARQLEATVNLTKMLEIAGSAEDIAFLNEGDTKHNSILNEGDTKPNPIQKKEDLNVGEETEQSITLAVARDEAFCFYYDANLREFTKRGVTIRTFSPLHDAQLPEADGILLGGGYPELYAKALSENESMRSCIAACIQAGIPSLAECGGFMYLHETLTTDEGTFPMVGMVAGDVVNQGKLVRFGYVEIAEKTKCFLGEHHKIKGHEFHYYDSTANGQDCVATKPISGVSWSCIHAGVNHFWGFPHLYYPSNPEFVTQFVERMKSHKNEVTRR